MGEDFINHPLINERKIQARIYQQLLFAKAIKENSLIVLPTGLGKTVIIIMVIAHYLKKFPKLKVIITAPTRPLVDQHYQTCVDFLKIDSSLIHIMSGGISPPDRLDLWESGSVFIATPQTLRNDIVNRNCDLTKISLICFDEAHRGVGDDPYVLSAEQYIRTKPDGRTLGFTASPGKNEKILEVAKNLGLTSVEYMDESHPQVKPYIHNTEENWIWVELPESLQKIVKLLQEYTKQNLSILKEIGVTDSIRLEKNPKRKILTFPKYLNKNRENLSDDEFFAGMSAYGQLMLVTQAVEMLETQGVKTVSSYIQDKIDEFQKSRKNSLRRFLNAKEIKTSFELISTYLEEGIEHPKLTQLIKIISKEINTNPESRILVFANYKATTQYLADKLNLIDNVIAHRFVGQSSSSYGKGLSQKRQKEVMDSFRGGEYNVLVSTSVGEEGLDVAQCDLVVFYDVTPSATRLIQRSGRTGRKRAGRVVILITKGTRDEGYFYASKNQRSKLQEAVRKASEELGEQNQANQTEPLESFFEEPQTKENPNNPISFESSNEEPLIYIDYREKGAGLLRNLMNAQIQLEQTALPIGDFIVSERVGIERKTVRDFGQTLIRGDLFDQLKNLKSAYLKPMLLIEGEDIYQAGLNPAAIRGALSSIMVDFTIPIIFTRNAEETVHMLITLAKREQRDKTNVPQIRTTKPTGTLQDEQLYLISSLPNIDRTLAERMLTEFDTPRELLTATQDELRKIHGIGPQIADRIDILLSTPYKGSTNFD